MASKKTKERRRTKRAVAKETSIKLVKREVAGVEVLKQSRLAEIGVSGLKKQAGIVFEELLKELQGIKGVKVFKEMSQNHPVIGGSLVAYKQIILASYEEGSREIESASDDNEDLRAAEFVEENLDDMSFSFRDTVSEILTMLTFGWAFNETVFKRRLGDSRDPKKMSQFEDGLFGWRKLAIRAQETLYKWNFDKEGGIQDMVQANPHPFDTGVAFSPFITIPIQQGLLFRTTTEKNNPEGKSLLRNAYISWFTQKHIQNIESVGMERDLTGVPVGWVPPQILDKNAPTDYKNIKNELIDMLANLRVDEQQYVLWPLDYDENGNKRWDLELMSSKGTRRHNTTEIINRYNREIAMSMLSDIILLGHEKVGSLALSQSKMELFSMALDSIADGIDNVFNRFGIPELIRINGFRAAPPRLKHGKIERVDIAELGEYISKIAGAGLPLFPDNELENALRRFGRLPSKPEE